MIYPSKEFLTLFKSTNGALSVTESIALMNIAPAIPTRGIMMELGTYKGKSAISIIFGLRREYFGQSIPKETTFYLVDPIFSDSKLSIEAGDLVHHIAISTSQVPPIRINTISDSSTNVIEKYDNYAYVMIDSGSHQDGLPMQEVKLLEDRVVKSGIIAFHDFQSQFVEVEQAYNYLISTGKYEPITINWEEIKDYVREHDLENGNISWHHQELDFPCFVGALRRNEFGNKIRVSERYVRMQINDGDAQFIPIDAYDKYV